MDGWMNRFVTVLISSNILSCISLFRYMMILIDLGGKTVCKLVFIYFLKKCDFIPDITISSCLQSYVGCHSSPQPAVRSPTATESRLKLLSREDLPFSPLVIFIGNFFPVIHITTDLFIDTIYTISLVLNFRGIFH